MRKLVAPLLLIGVLLLASAVGSADASPGATSSGGPTSVNSASIIAYATDSTTGTNPNGANLTLLNSNVPQYFYIRNTGTVEILALTLNISYSTTPAKRSLLHCPQNVLFSAVSTCSTGTSTLISTLGAITLNVLPGSWYAFEFDPKKVTTATISVSVASSQIRSATTTSG